MEKDAANDIGYKVLVIDSEHRHYLAEIRHWMNLRVANEGNRIWIRDFNEEQWLSATLKSIPFARLYTIKNNQAFPEGRLLPELQMPALLWAPVEKGLPLGLPPLNHNFFGIQETVAITLLPSGTEEDACALLVDMPVLDTYIRKAPAVRLERLRWCLLSGAAGQKALIYGKPLLPLDGQAFWQSADFLIPAGYNLEFPAFTHINSNKLNPEQNYLLLWTTPEKYTLIPKECLKPLSISSFRLTMINNTR